MSVPPGSARLDPEHLLAEDHFVRGLARQLVRDTHAAEDLAQQTFLAALQRPPAAGVGVRAWLGAVLRRLAGRAWRNAQRGHAREARAARAEAVPATDVIVAREALRAAVVRAVLALPPAYRDVVVLRHFEQLPPRAIARRLQLPVETVRTRHKRAMAQLRADLDHQTSGDRGAWCALLVPFTKAPPGALTAAAAALHGSLSGALLMTTKAKFLSCAAALGAVLMLTLWSLQSPTPEVPPADAVAERSSPEAAPPPRSASQTAASVRRTEEVGSTASRQAVASAGTGSVRIRVEGHDHSAVRDVPVVLCREANDELAEEPSAVSDADGEVRFADLAPGQVYAEAHRGGMDYSPWATVTAGQEAALTITLSEGMHLRGSVVDRDDRPIAGAEVLVSDWGGGRPRVLTRTDAAGRFAAASVGTHCHIGARAAGFAASRLRQFTAAKGEQAELRLVLDQPEAVLTGTVLGPGDVPVANALVVAGRDVQDNQTVAGAMTMGPRPERARSDAQGRFVVHHLAAGTVPVMVQARGCAPWLQDVAVGPTSAPVWVRLAPGAVVTGTARGPDGKPVAAAQVRIDVEVAGRMQGFGRHTRTQGDGSFALDSLPAGPLRASVRSERHGKASAVLQATAGETVRWDPVLGDGLAVRGVVLDADGKPVAHAMVEAQVDSGSAPGWLGFENTDNDGRFTLRDCAAGTTLRVTVRREGVFPELALRRVAPGPEDLVIRLPRPAWCYLQGKVQGPDGKPPGNVHLSPMLKGAGSSPVEDVDPTTGSFRHGPYPPGEYQVRVHANGYPSVVLPWRTLAPSEVWDLGVVAFVRGGSLRAQLVVPDGDSVTRLTAQIQDTDGHGIANARCNAGIVQAGLLAPGDYRLQVLAAGLAATVQTFTVRADVETRIEVPLVRGLTATLTCALPAGTAPDGEVELILRHGDGTLLRTFAWGQDNPVVHTLALRPGTWQVTARHGALQGAGTLTVTPGGEAPRTTVALTPR